MTMNYKLVVTVPLTHADIVREAIGDVGGGKVGNYSHCSFSSRGQGRSRPQTGAHPYLGEIGKTETIEEERIEISVGKIELHGVIDAIKKVHPYDEVAIDVYPLQDY